MFIICWIRNNVVYTYTINAIEKGIEYTDLTNIDNKSPGIN